MLTFEIDVPIQDRICAERIEDIINLSFTKGEDMKSLYHTCISLQSEVLFRDENDTRYFVNCLALSLFKSNTALLADSLMSDHIHLVIETEQLSLFLKSLKTKYSLYFRSKYSRSGIMAAASCHVTKLDGIMHILAALSYVFRNGLHHGLCSTAFEYPHSSVNCIYRKELGKLFVPEHTTSRVEISKRLPKFSKFPDNYVMDKKGMFLRESFVQIEQTEHFYLTPKTFIYYMNRLSSEEWKKEQLKDNNGEPPITLMSIENTQDENTLSRMLRNESGRVYKSRLMDTDICAIIDKQCIEHYNKQSVYFLSDEQKRSIANSLINNYHASLGQIKRTLIL